MYFLAERARGCGCLLLLAALYGFGMAAQGMWTAYQNPEPTELTCAEYAESQPDASWLRLEKCRVNLLEAVYERGAVAEVEDEPIEKAYLPLRPDDEPVEGEPPKTSIVVETRDDGITEFLTRAARTSGGDENKSGTENKGDAGGEIDPEMKAFLKNHQDQLMQVRAFEGTVEYGLNTSSETHEKVADLSNQLAEDFAVLTAGKEPSYASSLGSLGTGLVLLLVSMGLMAWGGDDEEPAEEDGASGAARTESGAEPTNRDGPDGPEYEDPEW